MFGKTENMAEEADLELECESEAPGSSSSQTVRKNIPIKLKQLKPKTKGRKLRNSKSDNKSGDPDGIDSSDEQYLGTTCDSSVSKNMSPSDSLFPCQPLLWNHKVNLIGTKVTDPVIHCCEKCTLPILTYGRMIPCKHVFCFDCAKKTEKTCPRCGDPVQRIEQSPLGSVFVCTYGGAKHGVSGCRRTYLSQRDLQAHINHRHLRQGGPEPPPAKTQQQVVGPPPPQQQQPQPPPPPQQQQQPQQTHVGPPPQMQPPGGHQPLPGAYVPVTAPSQPALGNLEIMPPMGQHEQVVYHRPPPMDEAGAMVGQPPPPPHLPQHLHGPPPPPQHPRVPPPPQPPQHSGINVPPPPPPQPQHVSVSMPPPPPPHLQQHIVSSHDNYSISAIPVMSSAPRTNLITVPIQDEGEYARADPQQHPPGFPPPGRNFNATPPPVPFPPSHPLQVAVHVPPPQQPPPFPPNSMALSPQGMPVATYAPSMSQAPGGGGPPPPLYSSQQTFTQAGAHGHGGPPPPPCVVSTQHLPGGPLSQPRVNAGPPPLSNPPPVGNPLQPHPGGPPPPPPRMGLPGSNQPPPRFPNPHGPYEEPPPMAPNYTPQPGSPRMAWTGGPPPRPPHPRPPGPVGPPPQQRPQTDNTHYNQYY